jgi:UDP-N-acetylglucosamine diphosphorylase / glucose-1-phosphate thymidylyltransferase / UDP-N-acetylgalactosamine diphosphorylase / glucosamine-1-phosphate N-acetyltransferase / galactosamine-1-phosphate N-acetyltransferase
MTPVALLFDDARARAWQPFALTRPAGELRFGAFTATERLRRLAGIDVAGHLSASHLEGFREPEGAPVIACAGIPAQPVLLLSARAIVDWSECERLRKAISDHAHGDAVVRVLVGGEPAGLVGSPSLAMSICERYADGSMPDPGEWQDVAHELDLKGVVLENVWDLVARSPEQTARDIEAEAPTSSASLPDGVWAVGEGRLVVEPGVTIEPGVVFDRAHGPIWLRAGVTVRAFSRIAGPTVVDGGTTLLGGPYDAVSIGPMCKIHGEVEETIILGYSNKAHDGFLGHAYLGRWVNLGALTTNSDLKNNYGSVRLDVGAGEVDTRITKLGCFLGDHVKTGIGMMLNTGTVVGAGTMIYGSGAHMPPKYVPPFVWGTGDDWVSYRFDKFVETARIVMSRRKIELDAANEEVLRRAWQDSMRGLEATA